MIMTKDNRTLILAGLMAFCWFLPLGISNHFSDTGSYFAIFKESIFTQGNFLVSLLTFLITFCFFLLPTLYILNFYKILQPSKTQIQIILLLSTTSAIAVIILFVLSGTIRNTNLFFYIYHLLFFYFCSLVYKAIS